MEIFRSLRAFLVGAAWAVLIAVATLLLYNWDTLSRMFTGHAFASHLPDRGLRARDILDIATQAAYTCRVAEQTSSGRAAPPIDIYYDPMYNNAISREVVQLYRIKDGLLSDDLGTESPLSKCLHRELTNHQLLPAVSADPEVLWIYLLFRREGEELLAIWPSVRINHNFPVKTRPWYPDVLARAETLAVQDEKGVIWQTRPYTDTFTGESVVTMLFRNRDFNPQSLTIFSGLDLRVDPFPSTFHLVIFLNFVALLMFSFINALATKQLDMEFASSWYWAWLCWALLYAVYATVYLLRVPLPIIGNARFGLLNILPALSLLNNAFFALAALQMLGKWTAARRALACSTGTVAALLLYLLAKRWEATGLLEQGGARWVDAIFSFLVSALLAWAFIAQIRSKDRALSGPEPFSVPVAQWLVCSFFIVFALHQLELAVIVSNPVIEQLFWLFSLVLKIGLAALYYIVILSSRYREEGEVGAIVFERMENGIIAVDSNLAIVAINGSAANLVGVRRGDVLGRDVREVAFRSLFETERLLEDLGKQGMIGVREILMKQYAHGYPGRFQDVVRMVSAQVVKDSEVDRIFALLYLHIPHIPITHRELSAAEGLLKQS